MKKIRFNELIKIFHYDNQMITFALAFLNFQFYNHSLKNRILFFCHNEFFKYKKIATSHFLTGHTFIYYGSTKQSEELVLLYPSLFKDVYGHSAADGIWKFDGICRPFYSHVQSLANIQTI